MTIALTQVSTVGLLLLTAAGYAIATIGMKQFSGAPGALAIALIASGLMHAVAMEVLLLRQGTLSLVYLGIMIAETALVMIYAFSIGHGLSGSQIAGAGLVLSGVALMGMHS